MNKATLNHLTNEYFEFVPLLLIRRFFKSQSLSLIKQKKISRYFDCFSSLDFYVIDLMITASLLSL